jgi:hypothetical protein
MCIYTIRPAREMRENSDAPEVTNSVASSLEEPTLGLLGLNGLRGGSFFHPYQAVAHFTRLPLQFRLRPLDPLSVPLPPYCGIVFHCCFTIV